MTFGRLGGGQVREGGLEFLTTCCDFTSFSGITVEKIH